MPAKEFRTKSGTLIAEAFNRVVHGDRGDYIEFTPDQIIKKEIYIPTEQEWRLKPEWQYRVFYYEYRSCDASSVMVYFQRKYVGYADYQIGFYYIAPADLIWEGELEE